MIAIEKPSSSPSPSPSLPNQPVPVSRATRRFLWIFSVAMILITASAFVFKLIEFAYSFRADQPLRFAMIPVVTYLIVAAGFGCLFLWAYLTGQFRNVEAPKYRMLEMQDQIDAQITANDSYAVEDG